MNTPIAIFWFRRDLRLDDNAGLYHALTSGLPVLPIFIFDSEILDKLEDKSDKRVQFIHLQVEKLKHQLQQTGNDLLVFYGKPTEVWGQILNDYSIGKIFANHDYEPYAQLRDLEISNLAMSHGVTFHSFKDQCIFEKSEIVKDDGSPYTVFTAYSKRWKAKLNDFYLKPYPTGLYRSNFFKVTQATEIPSLHQIGYKSSDFIFPGPDVSQSLVKKYDQTRNYPSIQGTSRLGVHFRFGTISIREKARKAMVLNETFLNELIWRDFYMMILHHFPHVVKESFRREYDRIQWCNNEVEFEAWCQGKTGYPIVDAGMRELNATGFMHNRTRMIVASFLTKHLLIDWRWGEAYFAQKLLDYDLSANNGGWQWAAGCGTDAAPYFRVFNPTLQTEKFDKDLIYIKRWVPEYGTDRYPNPIVEHTFARNRCLERYKTALSK